MSDLAWANEIGQASEDGDPISRWNAAVDSIMRERKVSRSAAIDIAQRDPEARGWLELSKAQPFIPVLAKAGTEANEQLDEMVEEMRRNRPGISKSAAWTAVVSAEPGRTLLRKSLVRSREANRPR
jgi:hypothetical protein